MARALDLKSVDPEFKLLQVYVVPGSALRLR